MKKIIIITAVVICLLLLGFGLHHKNKKIVISKPVNGSYVALGDSVAAGLGLDTYSDYSACDRTNQSYPNLVAAGLAFKLTSLACSGATLPSGILGSQDVNGLELPSQLSALFDRPQPNLITITIGANDIDWTGLITKCYTSECGTPADTAGVNQHLATVSTNLSAALTQIKHHYGASLPIVLVSGYHQVFPTSLPANCSDLTGIDAAELSWGRQQQSKLNTTIENSTAPFTFASFVPIDFSSHELCTSDPWVQGLDDNDPYHPTDAGQAAYSAQIIQAYKQFK
jgi:lysophospholipase L1-like esterase